MPSDCCLGDEFGGSMWEIGSFEAFVKDVSSEVSAASNTSEKWATHRSISVSAFISFMLH